MSGSLGRLLDLVLRYYGVETLPYSALINLVPGGYLHTLITGDFSQRADVHELNDYSILLAMYESIDEVYQSHDVYSLRNLDTMLGDLVVVTGDEMQELICLTYLVLDVVWFCLRPAYSDLPSRLRQWF